MRGSTDRILVTHVGALPASPDVWGNAAATDADVDREVATVIAKQKAAGVDFVNEGEVTKGGSWVTFINGRIHGFAPAEVQGRGSELLFSSKDWTDFLPYYQQRIASGTLFEDTGVAPRQPTGQDSRVDWECVEPLRYVGQQALAREIDTLKRNLGDTPAADAFLTSTAPLSIEFGRFNRYYRSDEEYLYALADVLRVEYEAIAAAGLQLQVDDAWLGALWDRIGIPMGVAAYRKYCQIRIEALNHALRNVPESQVRYHLCWGSWHGPHSQDIPMQDVVDLLLTVKARTYLFEAANVRHEHEYHVWESVKLPDDKLIVPGCVSHSTVLVEHPELVAERIGRFAALVGRERVLAGTDCGLGLRLHPQIAWAKLRVLAEGAALASRRLWKH